MAKRGPKGKPLCFHKQKQRHYKTTDGRYVWFGPTGPKDETFPMAWAEYQAWLTDQANPIKSITPLEPIEYGPGKLEIISDGQPIATASLPDGGTVSGLVVDNMPDGPTHVRLRHASERIANSDRSHAERAEAYATLLRFALGALADAHNKRHAAKPVASGPTLSEVLAFWQDHANPSKEHRRKTTQRYDHFVELIGDIRYSEMTTDHVRQYHAALVSEKRSGNDRHSHAAAVKLVLNFPGKPKAMKTEDYPTKWQRYIPVGLADIARLLNVDSEDKTAPAPTHKMRFPAEDFKKITATAIKAKDDAFHAAWLLLCQTGANLTELGALVWGETLIMNHATPHFHKKRNKKGEGERVIPLHPVTIAALKKYRDGLPAKRSGDGQTVFRSKGKATRNKPIDPDRFREDFEAMRDAAKVEDNWWLKHLRNIGPNVRRDEGLPIDMTWAFLGHTSKLGEAQKYEYQQPEQLLPLVNAIGKRYFGEEEKTSKTKKPKTKKKTK